MKFSAFVLFTLFLFSCNEPAEHKANNDSLPKDSVAPANALFGKTFRDPADLPELAAFTEASGSMLNPDGPGDLFGLSWLTSKGQDLLVLEKILQTPDGKARYEIIDTVQINNRREDQWLASNCDYNAVHEGRLVALVKNNEAEMYDTICKAWRIDLQQRKFTVVPDVSKIRCLNEETVAE